LVPKLRMIYKEYFSKKKINQVIFNRKINWYFDIKSILYQKKANFLKESKDHAKILNNDFINLKIRNLNKNLYKKKSVFTKKINWIKFTQGKDHNFRSRIKNIFLFLHKNNIQAYTKFFIVHGSLASRDYIKGWSDLDTFVVIKNEVLNDVKQIIKLRKVLRQFYLKLEKIIPFQHHGLILYTEKDLQNYLSGFLPIQALEKNFNLLANEKIQMKCVGTKKNLSLLSLKERLKYLIEGNKTGVYQHHAYKGVGLKNPLIEEKNQMYQLFCHIGYMLNIPILYFDATGRSLHKKKSFKKFYQTIKEKKIINLIKNSEKVRKFYGKKKIINNKIPKWIISTLGNKYLLDSQIVIKRTIFLINKYNKK